jgi:dUTP pyrophosphatase
VESLVVEIVRLDPGLPLPAYQRPGDAGLDLHAAADVTIAPGERVVIGTGIAIAIPEGYVGLATPRSGLAARSGLSIVNAPGVVDSGYRGEVKLILINHDPSQAIEIRRGERISQLVIVPFATAEFVERDELPATERGSGGHGSTGV